MESAGDFPIQTFMSNLSWKDDMKNWPNVTLKMIEEFLISTIAMDGFPEDARKSSTAFNYLSSGWVDAILMANFQNKLYLRANVCPSQSLNNKWHNAWVCFEESGQISNSSCSCMAGAYGKCSHVAAILYKMASANVGGHCGISCTDLPCSWNAGTKKNIVAVPLQNLTFEKPKVHQTVADIVESDNQGYKNKPISFTTTEEYQTAITNSGLLPLFGLSGTLLNETFTKIVPTNFHSLCAERKCSSCQHFFDCFINLDNSKISNIRLQTVDQSKSNSELNLWKEVRKVRITASSAKSIPVKESTDPIRFLTTKLYGEFDGNDATKLGLELEPVVLEKLSHVLNIPISVSGVSISEHAKWLCASPDGLTSDLLIEIKCPYRIRFANFFQFSEKYDATYDEELGEFKLNENGPRSYYLQIQIGMYVTKKPKTLFVYYLKEDDMLIDIYVPYNKEYTEAKIAKFEKFYFSQMLPYLATQYHLKLLILHDVNNMN